MGQIGFAVKFVLFFATASFLLALDPFQEWIVVPFTKFSAMLASKLLGHLGIPNTLNGFSISFRGHTVNIETECSATQVLLVFFSAVAAYPKTFREKLSGSLIGFLSIFSVNMLRIIVLFLVIVFAGRNFDLFHIYVGQAVVIASTFAVWQLWISGRLNAVGLWSRKNLDLLKRISIFFLTLIGGLVLYGKSINTPAANALAEILVGHSQLFLSVCGIDTQTSFVTIRRGLTNLQFISSCLAPPMSILYFAFLFASRLNLKTKAVMFIVSIPVFYLLGVIRISSFFISPSMQNVRDSFFFNHYYPTIFLFLLISGIIYMAFKDDPVKGMKYYALSFLTAVIALLAWKGIGTAYWDFFIMMPLKTMFGITALTFDPYKVFSAMPAFQFVLTVSLLAFLPGNGIRTNFARLFGMLCFLLLWQVLVIAFFNIYPIPFRAGYLRMLSLLPPVAGWLYFLWADRKKEAPGTADIKRMEPAAD